MQRGNRRVFFRARRLARQVYFRLRVKVSTIAAVCEAASSAIRGGGRGEAFLSKESELENGYGRCRRQGMAVLLVNSTCQVIEASIYFLQKPACT